MTDRRAGWAVEPAEGAPPAELHGLLIDELRHPPTSTVLVVEHVHWADDATLDLITVLGSHGRTERLSGDNVRALAVVD